MNPIEHVFMACGMAKREGMVWPLAAKLHTRLKRLDGLPSGVFPVEAR